MSYKDQYYSGRARHSHHSVSMNTPPPSSPSPISNGNNGVFSTHPNVANGDDNNNNNNNGKWNCSECTYLNAAHKTKCDMCLTPKPKQVKPISTQSNDVNNNSPKKPKGITFSHYDSPISPNSISSASRNYPNYQRQEQQQEQQELGKIPPFSILPENVSWNPKKPVSKQTIFERWMIAQIERCSGQQPAICIANNVLLTNLRRVRAPTTHYTIQQQIDANTNVIAHSNNLDAGDFTDDEEEDHSAMYPDHSPRSQGSANDANYSFTPTPISDNDDDEHLSMSFTPNRFATKPKSTQSQTSVFNGGRGRRKATHTQQASNEDSYDYNHSNGHHHNGHNGHNGQRAKTPKVKPKHSSKPLTKPKHSSLDDDNGYNKNKRNLPRTFSTDDANLAYNQKKLLNQRRRKKTNRKQQTVAQLWFKAQSQLKQGRNPPILAKFNITLVNIRQHNPRFKDYQRRKSHHEKAATYLQVTGDKIHTNNRKNIDHDDDDISDTENDLSAPSTPNTNSPNTPNSYPQSKGNNKFDPNSYVE